MFNARRYVEEVYLTSIKNLAAARLLMSFILVESKFFDFLLLSSIVFREHYPMTPAGEIYLPKEDYLKNKDFSVSRPTVKHWFVHEMTHVWQHQLGASVGWLGLKQLCKGGYTKLVDSADSGSGSDELLAYDTDILNRDENKRFSDLNFEQQGRVVEFYYDDMYLKKEEPDRSHHKKSLSMLLELQAIIMDLIIDATDKTLLPKD